MQKTPVSVGEASALGRLMLGHQEGGAALLSTTFLFQSRQETFAMDIFREEGKRWGPFMENEQR